MASTDSSQGTNEPVSVADVTQKSLRVLSGILDEMRKQAPELIASSTGQFGNLVRSVAVFQEAAVETHKQVEQQPPPSVERKPGDDPLAKAMKEWRESQMPPEKKYEQ